MTVSQLYFSSICQCLDWSLTRPRRDPPRNRDYRQTTGRRSSPGPRSRTVAAAPRGTAEVQLACPWTPAERRDRGPSTGRHPVLLDAADVRRSVQTDRRRRTARRSRAPSWRRSSDGDGGGHGGLRYRALNGDGGRRWGRQWWRWTWAG